MIVTRFKYPLERNLVKKLDLMASRVSGKGSKKDLCLVFEGGEGEGKTTFSIACAYYFAEQTGREFDESRVFFDVDKMIDYAVNTEKQIIIFDEPALQTLSTDWASSCVKNLTRLLMMARKKQHIILINMTKFYKFNEYIVVDRSIALIHVYSRKNLYSWHFQYIRKKWLESLWRDYRFSKRRNYKKYASKAIRGTFPDILNPKYKNNVLKEFDNDSYEKNKDNAIMQIGKETKRDKKSEWRVRTIIALKEKDPKITQQELSVICDCSKRTIERDMDTTFYSTLTNSPLNNNMGISDASQPDEPMETEEK